ncbi:MAG: class I SAM-dependent methyltransferase [Paracoccaceae bacterium]
MDTGGMVAFVNNPHLEYLKGLFDLSGRQVVDVGAGGGAFSVALAGVGAQVAAVEPNVPPPQLPAGVVWHNATAEALPLADASADLVCFVFSLHHVPLDLHPRAFAEARRVLRPKGRLHIIEPLTFGSMTEVLKFVEDETHVRTQTAAHVAGFAQEAGVKRLHQHDYEVERHFQRFDDFINRIVMVAPERRAALPSVRDRMKSVFEEKGEQVDGNLCLRQPCKAVHFEID